MARCNWSDDVDEDGNPIRKCQACGDTDVRDEEA